LFLSIRSNGILTRGPKSYTELPTSDNVIASIDEQGIQTREQPGVYFADYFDEIPCNPSSSSSNLSNDHELDNDLVSITDSEKEQWITVGPYGDGDTMSAVHSPAVDAESDKK
jgi:hypothetical protein